MRSLLDRAFRSLIVTGTLAVEWPDGSVSRYAGHLPGETLGVKFHIDHAVGRMLRNPGLAFGELWMDGSLTMGEGTTLYALLDMMYTSMEVGGRHPAERVQSALSRLAKPFAQFNPERRARRNVAHHYDLNGALYAMLLDPDLNYSCAYFATGDETLAEAQRAKQHHIAGKLLLDQPGLEVLDIGSGWGGLALTLARAYGARVLGVTLSTEQLARARARAEAEGLSDRVRFELIDYRELGGTFDRVVSVGMFEHVGKPQFGAFFRTLHRRLKPGGIGLLHAIGRSHGPGATNPWLAKYIFPGGYSPALSEVMPHAEASGLQMTDLEILRQHYATTLQHWRANLETHRAALEAMYDARFARMFELYLAGSELAFRHQGHMVWQMQLARTPVRVPLVRDYMYRVAPAIHSRPQAAALPLGTVSGYGATDHEHDHPAAAWPVTAHSALEPAGGTGAAGRAARQQQGL